MFMNCIHITQSALIIIPLFMKIIFFHSLFLLLLLNWLLYISIGRIRNFSFPLIWRSFLICRSYRLILLVIIMLVVFIFFTHSFLIMFSLYHIFNHFILFFALWVLAYCRFDVFKIHLVLGLTMFTYPVSVFYLFIFFDLDIFWFRFPIC